MLQKLCRLQKDRQDLFGRGIIINDYISLCKLHHVPDSKANGANMGPGWGRQDPGGPHVGPVNFAIWGVTIS